MSEINNILDDLEARRLIGRVVSVPSVVLTLCMERPIMDA